MAIVSRSSRFPKHWAVDVRGSCVGSYVHFVVKLNIFSHIKAVCGHKNGVDM